MLCLQNVTPARQTLQPDWEMVFGTATVEPHNLIDGEQLAQRGAPIVLAPYQTLWLALR